MRRMELEHFSCYEEAAYEEEVLWFYGLKDSLRKNVVINVMYNMIFFLDILIILLNIIEICYLLLCNLLFN